MAFEGVKQGIKLAIGNRFPNFFNPATSFIGRVYSVLTSAANGNTMRGSLSELSKPARVEPFTIISNDLMQREDVIHDVLDTVLSVFSAYYLQAISLDATIDGIRVADYLNKFSPSRAASGLDVLGTFADSAVATGMQLGLIPNFANESYSDPSEMEINPPYFNLKNYNFSLPFRSNSRTLNQPYTVSNEASTKMYNFRKKDQHAMFENTLKSLNQDRDTKFAEVENLEINMSTETDRDKQQIAKAAFNRGQNELRAIEQEIRDVQRDYATYQNQQLQNKYQNDFYDKQRKDKLADYKQQNADRVALKREELASKAKLDRWKAKFDASVQGQAIGLKADMDYKLQKDRQAHDIAMVGIREQSEKDLHSAKIKISNTLDQKIIDDKAIAEIKESSNQIVGKVFNVTVVIQGVKFTTPVTIRLIAVPATPDRVSFIMDGKRMDRTFSDRWRRWRAGRISFFRDLILCQDLIDEHKKRLLEDQDGILSAIEQRKSDLTKASLASNDISMSDATNIFIISKETETRIERDIGGKLSQQRTRDKIFSRTYAMLIVVVDLRSERVVIYTRGVSLPSTFSFRQLKNKTKNSNDAGVMEILKQLTMGNPPSF